MTIANDNVPVLPFYHADQVDRPNTVFPSSLALKQAFDSSTIALQTAINNLVSDLLNSTAGVSASESLGAGPITGVAGSTVFAQLSDLKAQIQTIIGGGIPPGGITTAMIQDGAVTDAKIVSVSGSKVIGGVSLLTSPNAWVG